MLTLDERFRMLDFMLVDLAYYGFPLAALAGIIALWLTP